VNSEGLIPDPGLTIKIIKNLYPTFHINSLSDPTFKIIEDLYPTFHIIWLSDLDSNLQIIRIQPLKSSPDPEFRIQYLDPRLNRAKHK
jgi:hypothetical protein